MGRLVIDAGNRLESQWLAVSVLGLVYMNVILSLTSSCDVGVVNELDLNGVYPISYLMPSGAQVRILFAARFSYA